MFVVNFAPIETIQFRNIPDNASPLEYIDSLKKLEALDWDRMITGHPYAGGRYGTKKDVADDIAYMEDLSTEVKKAADTGKCFDTAMKEVKLQNTKNGRITKPACPPMWNASATGGGEDTDRGAAPFRLH